MQHRRARPWLTVLLALGPLGAPAQPALLPVDEAAQQPDFFAFRARLQEALARRDTEAVLAVVHPQVRTSFGDHGGHDGFRRHWRPDAPDSSLWSTLATVLALGGSFVEDGSFHAPYVYSRWPDEVDAFEHRAVVGASVRVRAHPEAAAPIAGSVSFGIVAVDAPADPGSPWVRVRLPDGTRGYMAQRYLRSPVDYRAIFQRHDGRWQLTALVAGD